MDSTGKSLGLALLKVQINAYDSYQDYPSSFTYAPAANDEEHGFTRVPVLRIFGAFPTGHSVLVHVHNVYPYFFIEYQGRKGETAQQCRNLRRVLEGKLQESFRRKKDEENEDYSEEQETGDIPPESFSYIAGVSVIQATPFYGFHSAPALFYKIHLLNAAYVVRLSKILQSTSMQPYETHIPYTMQFLTDFNLQACGWLNLAKCYVRTPVLDAKVYNLKVPDSTGESLGKYLTQFLGRNVLSRACYPRMGKAVAEIDVDASWILNRHEVHEQPMRLYENLVPKPQGRTKRIASLEELVRDIDFQRRQRGIIQPAIATPVHSIPAQFSPAWVSDEERGLFEYATKLSTELHRQRSSSPLSLAAIGNALKSVEIPDDELAEWTPQSDLHQVTSLQTGTVMNVSNKKRKEGDRKRDNQEKTNQEQEIREKDDQEEVLSPTRLTSLDSDTSFDMSMLRQSQFPPPKRKFSRAFPDSLTSSPLYKLPPTQCRNKLARGYLSHFSTIGKVYEASSQPPDPAHIMEDFDEHALLKIDYSDPFYSNPQDLPPRPVIYSGKKFVLKSNDLAHIPKLHVCGIPMSSTIADTVSARIATPVFGKTSSFCRWEYCPEPPSFADVSDFLKTIKPERGLFSSQIDAYTQSYKPGLRLGTTKISRRPDGFLHLTSFGVEVFVPTRDGMKPDPARDPIKMIFYRFDNLNQFAIDGRTAAEGVLVLGDHGGEDNYELTQYGRLSKLTGVSILSFPDEVAMVNKLLWLVLRFDPDILTGYELHAKSWGYLVDRFQEVYDTDICTTLSRVSTKTSDKTDDRWGYTHASAIRITGRHMLNTWRHIRDTVALTSYTMENIAFHLLLKRVPLYSDIKLTQMCSSFRGKLMVIRYFRQRVDLNFRIIENQELITGTTEQARLMGMDFYSVLYRGSQFKVEAFLTRLSKAGNFIMVSPDRFQVRQQKPLECIPLVMEPESAFYKSPLVVLDFQSLYPSIMIAFNYCYSTMVGKLRGFNPVENKLGVANVRLKPGAIGVLKDDITISPTGMMFVSQKVRKSVLAIMLDELLETRVMTKTTMKELEDDQQLCRLYNSRQLALKFIANVTYGYTSASFSGRMPCSDLADSIVQTGREILSQSIDEIERGNWGAKVVYGDTDSLFVYFPGKSRDDAFRLGRAIAKHVTDLFPSPIELKFEKVYHPCVLLTKKRYVGYAYEWEDQTVPMFDAKGIETVRRDGIPAQAKIVEHTLRLLFETKDVSLVKQYVQTQFNKILLDRISVQDFCFAKEVRIGRYKSAAHPPPGAAVSMTKMAADAKAEPQYRERVPYVVIKGLPKATLRSRCILPEEFLADPTLTLDSQYYITKVLIPPLERIFNLMGVDVKLWFRELPRSIQYTRKPKRGAKGILGVVKSNACVCCAHSVDNPASRLCRACKFNEVQTLASLQARISDLDSSLRRLAVVCYSCAASNYGDSDGYADCTSADCPVYYTRVKALNRSEQLQQNEARTIREEFQW
ncbi:hypothetical protein BABINDRAFT_66385 [Babjeviella inositovora NRRL Y-12698]|uniref:DNA polymerase n=1 Tax=Babjeviella inositovora NRRL Y-12698 TaxID=984486 RepID=A0A1E3QJC8_9ASCO|nr:uncharacterized protein BABINDRAFT_66385 [Babjeviella inositovora NRRL Y-12698]ODQ77801.1 hypothetical protein BABINDRAFT_66385 [Babjeviella inositovora NRRL Y-12698]